MLNRMVNLAVVAAVGLGLAGCGEGGGKASGGDPYAGVDQEIRAWREDIEAANPICKTKVDGKGCEGFEVGCKAAQTISPAEQQAGVSAKLIAAMTFHGKAVEGGSDRPGSAFATFSNTNGKWVRAEAEPVNLRTCAPF